MNKFISAAALAAMALGFAACDGKDDPTYKPAAPAADAQRVYFQSSATSIVVDAQSPDATVKIYRPATENSPELTVQLLATGAEGVLSTSEVHGLFTVPTEVTFAAGEPMALIPVVFDLNELAEDKPYTFSIAVDEANANEYGITSTNVTITYSTFGAWKPFVAGAPDKKKDGQGYYVFSGYYSGVENPVQVIARSSLRDPNVIEFQFQWLIDNDDPSLGWDTFLTANTTDGGVTVVVEPQHFADNENYSEGVWVVDSYTRNPEANADYEGATYFDPETGAFHLVLDYYVPGLGFFSKFAEETCQLNGYLDLNEYVLELRDGGKFTEDGQIYEMIAFYFNSNVASVAYTVLANETGSYTEEEIAQIAEKIQEEGQDTYEVHTIDAAGIVKLAFEDSGDYTIVAVGYNDSGEAKATASLEFFYDIFNPYKGWSVVTDEAVYVDYFLPYMAQGALPVDVQVVEFATNDNNENLVRVTNPYAASDYPAAFGCAVAEFGSIEMEFVNGSQFVVPMSHTGIMDGEDEIILCSLAYDAILDGDDASEIPALFLGTYDNATGTFSQSATGSASAPSFMVWFGEDGPYAADIDFYVNIAGQAPAAAPARKANAVKQLLDARKGKKLAKAQPKVPARFKAAGFAPAAPARATITPIHKYRK